MSHFASYDLDGVITSVSPMKTDGSVPISLDLATGIISGATRMDEYFVVTVGGEPVVTNDAIDIDIINTGEFFVVPTATDYTQVLFRINVTSGKITVAVPTAREKPLTNNQNKEFNFKVISRDYSVVYGDFVVSMEELMLNGFVEFAIGSTIAANAMILTEVVFTRYGIVYDHVADTKRTSNIMLYSSRVADEDELNKFSGVVVAKRSGVMFATVRGMANITDNRIINLIFTKRGDFSIVYGQAELDLDRLVVDKYQTLDINIDEPFDITTTPFTNDLAIYDGKIPYNTV